jgi:hypothetical protein
MDAPALVAHLRSRGIMLAVSAGNLVVDHNGELTDTDRDMIRANKPVLLAELAGPESPAPPAPPECHAQETATPDPSGAGRRMRPILEPDDPRYRRTCTRCGEVRNWRQPCVVFMDPSTGEERVMPPESGLVGRLEWTDFGCPKCGNPEFSLPTAKPDFALEAGMAPAEAAPPTEPPTPPVSAPHSPWFTPERQAKAARGDELRRLGWAVPLCWLPPTSATNEGESHAPPR